VIRGFSSAGGGDNGNGIELNSTAPCAVTIVDTLISDNGGMGIDFNPRASMTGTLDRITLLNNDGDGVIVRGPSSVTAVRSLATGNANVGFNTNNGFANAAGTPTLTLREVTVTRGVQSFGAGTGIEADAGVIRLAHSVVSGNQVGIAVAGGAVESYGDNDLRDNVTDVTGSLTPVANQ